MVDFWKMSTSVPSDSGASDPAPSSSPRRGGHHRHHRRRNRRKLRKVLTLILPVVVVLLLIVTAWFILKMLFFDRRPKSKSKAVAANVNPSLHALDAEMLENKSYGAETLENAKPNRIQMKNLVLDPRAVVRSYSNWIAATPKSDIPGSDPSASSHST